MATEAEVHSEIESQILDNFMNLISAEILRPVLHDMVDFSAQGSSTFFNVMTYGAVGDGVADDSVSILATVNAAYLVRGAVYFPAGTYRITQNAVLTQTVELSGHGLLYFGDGMSSSILQFDIDPNGSSTYFYQNTEPRMSRNSFVDLAFIGTEDNPADPNDLPDAARGFSILSEAFTGANEQNFHFTRCRFEKLNFVMECEGDETASEMTWVQCEFISIKNTVLLNENIQSFNHEFHSCNLTLIYGDAFVIDGGGAIKMYGGSVILNGERGDLWFFRGIGAGSSLAGNPNSFNGIRFELRGNNARLVNLDDAQQFDVSFGNCLFEDQGNVEKVQFVTCGPYSHVSFDNCNFYEIFGSTIDFEVVGTDGFNESGSIVFDSCGLPDDWSDRCSVENFGMISARNCYGNSNVGASNGQHWAHDFDVRKDEAPGIFTDWSQFGGSTGSPSDNMLRLKCTQFYSGDERLRENLQLKLPRNAIIKNIFLRMPSNGTDATVVTMNVNRLNKTGTPHLTSNSQPFNVAHTGDTTNYFYNVGTTTNERNLVLYPSAVVTGTTHGGFCILEYY